MRKMQWGFLVAAWTICVGGCDAQPAGPAEQFVQDQEGIVTRHGRIEPSSVQANEGQLQYKTTDGRAWRVSKTDRPDGTRDYSIPEEVLSSEK